MTNPFRRISVRLTLWHSAATLVVVGILSWLLYFEMRGALLGDLDRHLSSTAQSALALVDIDHGALAWEGNEPDRILPLPQRGAAAPNLVQVTSSEGVVLSASPVPGLELIAARVRNRWPQGGRTTTEIFRSEAFRVRTEPIVRNGRCLGTLQVASSLAPMHYALGHLARLLAAGGVFALCLSLAVGYFLARRALSPVHAITRAAATIEATSLSRRLRLPETGDELSYLAASFDAMLDRIENAYHRQREFAANASHELRTPLSLIHGEASLARRPGADPAAIQAALATIEAETDRLAATVTDLLLLARLDRGELLRSDLVALDELAHDVGGRNARAAREKGISLVVEADDAVAVRGDELALARVLTNLVQNALEHTREGEIRISVARKGEGAEVRVSDTGDGVPAEHLDRVFDRFYRADQARSGGGVGLGLALCRDIIEAHGGVIELACRPAGGTTATIRLPVLPEQ